MELKGIIINEVLNYEKTSKIFVTLLSISLMRIRKCLALDKGKLLGNAFIDSQFIDTESWIYYGA